MGSATISDNQIAFLIAKILGVISLNINNTAVTTITSIKTAKLSEK